MATALHRPSTSPKLAELRARLLEDPARPALVTPQGTAITFQDLVRRADAFSAELGERRRLLFLEARNDAESISAYLGCILNGHPFYLFNGQDGAAMEALAARYLPDAVIRPGHADPIVWREAPGRDLHPDLALLLSTSGSTGSPKFVKLSLGNILSNAQAIAEYLQIGPDDRAITALGFNYSYGLSVVNSHLFAGASLLLETGSVIDPAFWRSFRDNRATSFAGVPYSFEMLAKGDGAWASIPSLRHVTQAGGALSPELVRHFAKLGREHGWRFYAMYGQTECAPRIAYLPPAQAEKHPGAIGVPIPGGALRVVDESGQTIEEPGTPGELVYAGPNVMMGYAAGYDDLADGQPPGEHRTGDLGYRNAEGLFFIVGRLSRFIKPFGLRVNLDELQASLRPRFPELVCTGTDTLLVLALPGPANDRDAELTRTVTRLLKLPASILRIVHPDTMPRLSNGKPDFAALKELALAGSSPRHQPAGSTLNNGSKAVMRKFTRLASRRFASQVLTEARRIIGLGAAEWHGVRHLYATLLDRPTISGADTFVSLSGDSLSYVQASIALEQYLGHLPPGWESLTVDQLEREACHAPPA